MEIKLPKQKYSYAESVIYKRGYTDGYLTAKKEYFAEKSKGGKAGGKARWAGTTLEDRVEFARMMKTKQMEKKAKKSHTSNT
jgi:hypothetical protein